MNGGADVLLQNTDSTAVLQAAEKAGKFAFGWDSDMSAAAPKAHLGSAVLNWGVYYEKVVNDVLENKWASATTKWGTKEGMNDFIKTPDTVPEPIRAKVDAVKAGLKDGSFAVFKGPMSTTPARKCWPRTRSATTPGRAASTSTSRAWKASRRQASDGRAG
jgi:basic membrane protein A